MDWTLIREITCPAFGPEELQRGAKKLADEMMLLPEQQGELLDAAVQKSLRGQNV